MTPDEVAKDIVDAAIKVHRALGPGLLQSAYQACLAHELRRRQHRVECEVARSLQFEGVLIEVGYRINMRIEPLVLVENKTRENSYHPHCTADLSQIERLVFGIDYYLERDFATRRHPARGAKPS